MSPTTLKILSLRGQIAELGGAIRQLQQSGLDSATAQLLISRRRAELEWLMKCQKIISRQKVDVSSTIPQIELL
jgi:hypothetical protein